MHSGIGHHRSDDSEEIGGYRNIVLRLFAVAEFLDLIVEDATDLVLG